MDLSLCAMEPPSADAATAPKTVQIRLGKCKHHLRLLYQCRRKKALVVMEEEEEAAAAAAAAPAAPMGNPDSCHILYESACLNNDEVRLGKCELHLPVLFVCHMRARELWS
ncbi:hypothetical protein SETIT_9G099900v2 [Setaria italica]|uniref:Uncharacterized protein n=1 Tax=Setaria italica TaxID=4555 RepID=A0A368SF73_SETIT|nr:hypothetical protein SETIT_9G099900v2 [Setaria italica]